MKNAHVHVHGALDSVLPIGARADRHSNGDFQRDIDAISAFVGDDGEGIKRDQQGRFATSSGTGEQHAATAALHESLATRKGTDHPHHAFHMAAAEQHTQAANFLAQANKAQHPGAAVAAEHAAKQARTHENVINKGKGSDPKGEVGRQNKAMSDPRVMKENAERKKDFDAKHDKGSKKKPTKDELIHSGSESAKSHNIATEINAGKPKKQAIAIGYSVQWANDCGCRPADSMGATIDPVTQLPDYKTREDDMATLKAWNSGVPPTHAAPDQESHQQFTGDVLFTDASGWTQDDWGAWNEEHHGTTRSKIPMEHRHAEPVHGNRVHHVIQSNEHMSKATEHYKAGRGAEGKHHEHLSKMHKNVAISLRNGEKAKSEAGATRNHKDAQDNAEYIDRIHQIQHVERAISKDMAAISAYVKE